MADVYFKTESKITISPAAFEYAKKIEAKKTKEAKI